MKKIFSISVGIFFALLFCSNNAKSQSDSTQLSHIDSLRLSIGDSTPFEYLEYQLSKDEFMEYYGTDDTARRLINFWFRKRTFSVIEVGLGTGIVAGEAIAYYIAGLFPAAIAGVAVYGAIDLIFVIRLLTYSRERLLRILVDRENGYAIPYKIVDRMYNSSNCMGSGCIY